MNYALRIQALDGYSSIMESLFSGDRFSRSIRIHHTGKKGDNPHYHLLITTDYKHPALRMELKRHFTLAKGNRHMSIKVWDGNIRAISYLFHEGTEPDLIRGFNEPELQQAKELNKLVKAEIKKNSPAQIVEEATDYFQGQNPSPVQLFSYIYDRYKSAGDWLPNKYQFERYIHRILANLSETPAEIYAHKKLLLTTYGFVNEYSITQTDLKYENKNLST
jgi:hypothetical protein